jgi:hypothetical protein
MRNNYLDKVLTFIQQAGYEVRYRNDTNGILKIGNEQDGISQVIIGVVPPILIIECYLFSIHFDSLEIYKSLLQKNRDMLHGAFVLNEDGTKILYRYTIQIENLDYNEFEAALNALSLLLHEYSDKILHFSNQQQSHSKK